MNKTLRLTAYLVLKKVYFNDAYLNMAIKTINTCHLDTSDTAFVTRLTHTVLEHQNQIDYAYAPLVAGKRIHTAIRIILRMAVAEMLFLNTPDRAAINEAVSLTERIGKAPLKGFVNAVLRKFSQNKNQIVYPNEEENLVEYLNVFSGYQKWLIEEVIGSYGVETAKALLLYKKEDSGSTNVRLNTLKGTPQAIAAEIKADGLEITADSWFEDSALVSHFTGIEQRDLFRQGKITVMGLASMLAVRLCGVKPGMRVLDACAAPGGKTAYLAALMENTGNITAWDIHPHRVELIEKNMNRLGVTNVETDVKDAAVFDSQYTDKFDLVLADMPCTSLGLAYRKPDIKRMKTEADALSLANIQKQLLSNLKRYVKPGGTLLAATCSITKAESDIDWFFKENSDFEEEITDMPNGMEYVKLTHGIQLLPDISGTDGFFICKMKRS